MASSPRVSHVLLVLALWSVGCTSLPPPAGSGLPPRETLAPEGSHPRRSTLPIVRVMGPGGGAGTWRPGPRGGTSSLQAVQRALEEVSNSLSRTTPVLARLEADPNGLVYEIREIFSSFIEDAVQERQWVSRMRDEAQRIVQTASEVEDPDLQQALLRLAGPRLEAALCGAQLLAAWVDFLQLVKAVLPWCPPYSLEHLFRQTAGMHKKLTPAMAALASLEPERLDDTASALPELLGTLNHEFESIREGVVLAQRTGEQIQQVRQLVEGLTLGLAVGMVLPPGASAAPVALGAGVVMGSEGAVVGSQVVISAEWAEAMRQLVQAGVIVAPVVGAAVQMHAGQVLMSQSGSDLPKGVREALGEGPEVRGMRQTGRAGAGMSESPRHHVLPREYREWFEQRGFTGEMDIDQFCVEMEQAKHEAIHGGGNWSLGRQWPGEWNRMIMKALREAETEAGRVLTRSEILNIVAERMQDYGLTLDFVPWRGP